MSLQPLPGNPAAPSTSACARIQTVPLPVPETTAPERPANRQTAFLRNEPKRAISASKQMTYLPGARDLQPPPTHPSRPRRRRIN